MPTSKIKKQTAKTLVILSFLALLVYPMPPGTVLAAAEEQWAGHVRINTATAGTQRGNVVTQTFGGEYIVIWQDATSGNHFAQKIDGNGARRWGGDVQLTNINGADFIDVVADNAGGVFYTFINSNNLYVNHIDAAGTLWQTNGFQVYNDQVNDAESIGGLLHDGSGGVYVTWAVLRSGSRFVEVTRLNNNGSVHSSWNTSGSGTFRPVEFTDTVAGNPPRIVDASAGNIIITYEGATNSLRTRKLDSSGTDVWGASTATTNAQGIDGWMTTADGNGGVIIAYNSFSNFPYDMKTARVDTNGTSNWTTTIGTANNFAPYPHIVSDGSGGAIVFWNHEDDGSGDVDIYGQKVNAAGAAQWNGGSMLAVANDSATYSETLLYDINHSIVSDGAGGAFIGLAAVGGDSPSAIQYVESDGTKNFGTHGYYLGFKGWYTTLAPDGSGGVVATWTGTETAVGTDYDIWGQRLTSAAPPPVPEGAVEIHIVDNVTGSASTTGAGISNGNDAGALADINFTGAPADPPRNIFGAERYTFSGGEPAQSSISVNFENLPGTEFPASGGGNLRAINDGVTTAIPLGFTTQIYGQNVDTAVVSSNGFVYLNSSANMSGINDGCCRGYSMSDYPNLPASVNGSGTGDILIAGKWTDLNPGGEVNSSVRYSTDGIEPNRRFVITFDNVQYANPSPTPLNAFEIKILESVPGFNPCDAVGSEEFCGTQTISSSTLTFQDIPDTFSFGTITEGSTQHLFNNVAPPDPDEPGADDLLQIFDDRNSGGFTVTIDADGTFIDETGTQTIPLSDLYIVTSLDETAPGNNTGVTYGPGFAGDNNVSAPLYVDVDTTDINATATYTNLAPASRFGGAPLVVMDGTLSSAFGRDGIMSMFANFYLLINPSQPAGSYSLKLTYTLADSTT